jgi:pimeloyl-ACP methyl ester carboxylesterase
MTNFVLVHGAFVGADCWRWVRPLLWQAGHAAYTPSLTGLGERTHLATPQTDLSLHVRDVVSAIEYEGLRDLVLVGHSYGGMVISMVADQMPDRVSHLVYLDALLPLEGESMYDVIPSLAEKRPAEGWLHAAPFEAIDIGPPGRKEQVRMSPMPVRTMLEGLHLDAPTEDGRFTRTYVKATADLRPEPPRTSPAWVAADRVRDDARWRYLELPTRHAMQAWMPKEVTKILLDLA